jgi:hypothetical protein
MPVVIGWLGFQISQRKKDGPFDLTKAQNLPLEAPVKMIVLDAIAKALADVIGVKRLGDFSLISRLYSYFRIPR